MSTNQSEREPDFRLFRLPARSSPPEELRARDRLWLLEADRRLGERLGLFFPLLTPRLTLGLWLARARGGLGLRLLRGLLLLRGLGLLRALRSLRPLLLRLGLRLREREWLRLCADLFLDGDLLHGNNGRPKKRPNRLTIQDNFKSAISKQLSRI